MSVLIKGMDMPKDCFECVFFDEEHNWCDMQDEHLHNQKDETGRAKWCPLVEVPTPHGRLIDADELKKRIEEFNSNDIISYTIDEQEWRENTPTVIEAEE